LQPSIPYPIWLALHWCLQRHGISRLPDIEGDKPKRQRFKMRTSEPDRFIVNPIDHLPKRNT